MYALQVVSFGKLMYLARPEINDYKEPWKLVESEKESRKFLSIESAEGWLERNIPYSRRGSFFIKILKDE